MSFTVSQLAGLRTTGYANVAGVAILVYDYMITLEDEVQWVWGRSWDVTRIVFMVSRYLPFAGVGLTAYAAVRSASDPCPPSIATNITHTLSIIASEVLLILRTYAFWQGDKRVLCVLIVVSCLAIAAAITANVTSIPLLPNGYIPPSCFLIASRNGTLVYLSILAFEIVILILTAYKQFQTYRNEKGNIARTIYRDGMFYILCVIFITTANVIVDGIFPFQFSDLLDILQITIHSVLASRILFNLRKSTHVGKMSEFSTLTDIAYKLPSDSQLSDSESESVALPVVRNDTNSYVDV